MAARRLLIVMLILLGLSTLAAALVPQHALRTGTTTRATTTQQTQSTATAPPPVGRSLSAKIVVGGKKVPVVAGPVCAKRKPSCEPIQVGDQLSLRVLATAQAQVEIPAFGLIGVAGENAPAYFQLLLDQPGTLGILFTSTHRVAARIEVLSAAAARRAVAGSKPKSRARGG